MKKMKVATGAMLLGAVAGAAAIALTDSIIKKKIAHQIEKIKSKMMDRS